MNVVLYIHGKDGSAAESEHYKPLFPDCEVVGLDYQTFTPWETGKEICIAVEKLKARYENIILIANSIGAYFSMHAGINRLIQKAFFIFLHLNNMLGADYTAQLTTAAVLFSLV